MVSFEKGRQLFMLIIVDFMHSFCRHEVARHLRL